MNVVFGIRTRILLQPFASYCELGKVTTFGYSKMLNSFSVVALYTLLTDNILCLLTIYLYIPRILTSILVLLLLQGQVYKCYIV